MATMLRVHSQDLHEHVASEAGECLDSGLYTDLAIRCIARGLIGLHTCIHNMSTPLQPSHLIRHSKKCLTYNTIQPRCHGGDLLRAHRIVLAAVSPYLRQLLATGGDSLDTLVTLDLPDAAKVGSQHQFCRTYNYPKLEHE